MPSSTPNTSAIKRLIDTLAHLTSGSSKVVHLSALAIDSDDETVGDLLRSALAELPATDELVGAAFDLAVANTVMDHAGVDDELLDDAVERSVQALSALGDDALGEAETRIAAERAFLKKAS